MTAVAESTKRKLSLLQLAEELGNVSKACKIMGYHRDTFYEVRRAFQVGGVGALVEQVSGHLRADKSGAACNQCFHGSNSLSGRKRAATATRRERPRSMPGGTSRRSRTASPRGRWLSS